MKKINALVMSLIMLFTVLAPAQNVEAAGKSLKVSEKAFFKEMKEFDYKGMNRYVKDWGEGGQFVSVFYMVPSGKKYFAKCASKMSYRIISTKKKGNKADVKVKFRYVNCEDFTFNFCMNAFYYMADGKLDNLSSMSEKQVIKLVNEPHLPAAENGQLILVLGVDILPIHKDLAGGGAVNTAQNVQQSGFTGTGGADDGQELPLLHGEGNVVHRPHLIFTLSVYLTEMLDLHQLHSRVPP